MKAGLRLCEAALDRIPDDVERPGYDRRSVSSGVVHIGPGAFHRAHQAVVFDDLIRAGDRRWGITGISLRSASARAALEPQDGLYTLAVRQEDRDRLRIIGALRRVLVLAGDTQPILEALAGPQVAIITLTITEAGYTSSASVEGLLAAGLALRRSRGLGGLTVVSCDNLSRNGARLGELVIGAAADIDPRLADWVRAEVAFPSTMVDRITPATTEADIEALAARTGFVDRAMVRPEAFSQWVIEDRFAGSRPDFAAAGVQVVGDVAPFEQAKLRLLNGAHSAMAYLGGLAGLSFVHEFVADPAGSAFVERLWNETQTTLVSTAADVPAYRLALAARFADPATAHRLTQIAADGSQKLPERLLAPLAVSREQGLSSPALVLAVAAWIRWQSGKDDDGRPLEIRDPLAGALRRHLAGLLAPGDRVAALLSMGEIFPPRLSADPLLREGLTAAVDLLDRAGARRAMATLAETG